MVKNLLRHLVISIDLVESPCETELNLSEKDPEDRSLEDTMKQIDAILREKHLLPLDQG